MLACEMKVFRHFAYAYLRCAILVSQRNYGIQETDGCAQTPLGAMLQQPCHYRHCFMYAAARRILGEGKWPKPAGSQWCV